MKRRISDEDIYMIHNKYKDEFKYKKLKSLFNHDLSPENSSLVINSFGNGEWDGWIEHFYELSRYKRGIKITNNSVKLCKKIKIDTGVDVFPLMTSIRKIGHCFNYKLEIYVPNGSYGSYRSISELLKANTILNDGNCFYIEDDNNLNNFKKQNI